MKPYGSLFPRTALAVAVALVAAAPAMAQNTTAAISGRVVNPEGRPVAGATVVVLHRESGSTSTLTTDGEGRYNARGLRAGGPYTVTVSKDGERSVNDDVYLVLAETTLVDFRIGAAAQQLEQVVVTTTASRINSSATGAGTNLTGQDLAAFASIQRNLQDYARLDPRLSQTDKERGEISAAGQNSRYNSITIDGVTTSDTFGLEANNLPTAKQPISIDAIQSVQVNLSNYDVTQKGYTGANINAVTKSGTNDLRGSVYFVYRDGPMIGERFNRTNQTYFSFQPFVEKTIGATLSGPLIKDRLFFFASVEELTSSRTQPEFGPIGSPLTNVAISQSAIDSLTTIAKSRYNIDVGTAIAPTKLNVKDALVKLDWNIADGQRASLRVARTDQSETNFGNFSATSVNLTSWWWNQKKQIDTVVGQWFADWTDNFSTELKISSRDYDSVPLNNSNLPAMALQFTGAAPVGSPAGVNTGSRFLNFGTELSRHYNELRTKTLDAYFGGNLVLGDHELKFGVDVARNEVFNAFFQNTKGNYTFNCREGVAYNNIPGIAPGTTLATSGNTNRCSSLTSAQLEAAVLENFQRGRPSSFQVQLPVAGGTLNDGIAQWTLSDIGLMIQDTWNFSDRLTLGAGVRVDSLQIGDKPQRNSAAAAPQVAGSVTGNTVVRNTGGFGLDNTVTVDGKDLFQPRFSFNYQLSKTKGERSQVRGGFGLFQGAAANVWLSNPFSNTGLATRVVGCGGSFPACPTTDGFFVADPNAQPSSLPGTPPAANVDFIDPKLSQPSVWKLNLAFERQLPLGFEFSAEWLHTRTNSGIYYQHLNLGAPTRTGKDGRELFYTPQGYDPACWTATGGTVTSGGCAGFRNRALSNASFNNVLLAKQTDKGQGNAVTLAISQRPMAGVNLSLAYTRTSATEVSPLTSSVANSNFNSRSILNPNEEVAANSAYLIRDRFNASANLSRAFIGNYKTTLGVVYEGRRGKPYSWTFRNDLNGDGVSGNDLMYIPSGVGSGEVVFLGDTASSNANEMRFWSVVDSFKSLRESKGRVVSRNSELSPFVNNFDLRLSQEIPGFSAKHKGVLTVDVLNFGNMLNKRWGRINEIGFSSAGGQRRTFVNYAGLTPDGKYIYNVANSIDDLTLRQVRGESQWALQVTARYEF